MDQQTFGKFRDLIYRESGITLGEEKVSLLTNRLAKRVRELQLRSEAEYFQILETDLSGEELVSLLNSISTNTTFFYREERHFEVFRECLRERARQHKDLKVWCAASSTGEEPYTLAFEVLETLGASAPTTRILATDISTKVLQQAVQGRYPGEALAKIPPKIADKYVAEEGDECVIKQAPRDLLLFKRLNLMSTPYPLRGPIDIIFCRNVMIYFDLQARQKVVNEMYRLLAPGGYFFISHSESLLSVASKFERVDSSVFRKPR